MTNPSLEQSDGRFDAVCVGEGMLELSCSSTSTALGFGGDALNTGIHLARAGFHAAFFSALGTDPFSLSLRDQWEKEGLDCSLVQTHPDRSVGLYAIHTDGSGERSFQYWRDSSAARETFSLPETAQTSRRAAQTRLLVYSLISLAVLPDDGRRALLALARQVRDAGGMVAFDSNYRPRLWSSPDIARTMRDAAIATATIGLPTLDDEKALGMQQAEECAVHWQSLGCEEVVVKLGEQGCRLPDGTIVPLPQLFQATDTSGAGDAFNAGYLCGRLNGHDLATAALCGHRLAGAVVQRNGAIPKLDQGFYAEAGLCKGAPSSCAPQNDGVSAG